MNARDAYLAYQAEIGTEEVVLPHPLIRKVAVEIKPSKPSADFFQSVEQTLNAPVSTTPLVVEPVKRAPVSAPEFKDLNAYWEFLEQEYPKWFSSTTRLVQGVGPKEPILAIVELSPTDSSPEIFGGEPGQLLDKMMKAIDLDRDKLYLTSLMKTPAPERGWPRKDLARMVPFLYRELALAGCTTILLLGETCAQALLRTGKNLSGLRQQTVETEALRFTASHHPVDLEKNQELKREAWEDLKWLRTRLGAV
ncbi:MAG TPA: hypothetical protein DCQ83_01450 [Fibrobacteres bacterium]|jgi:uracil-DNA glycosylase family 4|nr:hypothetical protein [Fibrobacterota bacterium]